MIHLDVIKSTTLEAIGSYQFDFDQIHIGRSKKNDLIFLDKELPLKYFSIKIYQGLLIIQSHVSAPAFFINGKKVNGTLKLKLNDKIAFGSNEIQIVNFGQSLPEYDLTNDYERFINEASELTFTLEFIEEVLVKMENNKNVQK